MTRIKFSDLTIVKRNEFDGRLNGRGRYVSKWLYWFPNCKEVHGKEVWCSDDRVRVGGIMLCSYGENEIVLSTNNVNEMKLRSILPMLDGAKMVSSKLYDDYKDDPYGNMIRCGSISYQKWDISGIYPTNND